MGHCFIAKSIGPYVDPAPAPIPTAASSVLNTYANSTAVRANATGFQSPLLSIEQQITARGG